MQINLQKEYNLWPTSTIAGGESPYISFSTAKTSLHMVCTYEKTPVDSILQNLMTKIHVYLQVT